MCWCLWLRNIFPDWPSLRCCSHPQVLVCVPVALLKTDTAATRKIAASSRAFLSMHHFYLLFFPSIYFLQSPAVCGSFYHSASWFHCPCFTLSTPFETLLFSLPLLRFSSFPLLWSVHSLTQYCIERFPSLLSDLAVIEPERSQRIDFSEKDTVMSGNLLLPCTN